MKPIPQMQVLLDNLPNEINDLKGILGNPSWLTEEEAMTLLPDNETGLPMFLWGHSSNPILVEKLRMMLEQALPISELNEIKSPEQKVESVLESLYSIKNTILSDM